METVKKCVKCGGFDRYRNGACRACKSIYTAAHREHKKAYNARYQIEKAVELKVSKAIKYVRTRDKCIAAAVAYSKANREQTRDADRRWAKNNRDKVAAKVQYRNALKLRATPGWFGEFDAFVLKEAYNLAQRRSALTGIKWHVDHIVPLRSPLVSGFHISNNIQVIPATANIMKSNRVWPDMPTCHTEENA